MQLFELIEENKTLDDGSSKVAFGGGGGNRTRVRKFFGERVLRA
jgi:hypothetical protein